MREFRELELCNDFLFYQVMQNEDVCKDVLSLILGKKLRKVRITSNSPLVKNIKEQIHIVKNRQETR